MLPPALSYLMSLGLLVPGLYLAAGDTPEKAPAGDDIVFSHSSDWKLLSSGLKRDAERPVLGAELLSTVQVRKPDDFPVILHPGQRAAVSLDNLPSRADLLVTCRVKFPPREDSRVVFATELVFNGKSISRRVSWEETEISAFIPSAYIECFGNVFEVRNTGTSRIGIELFTVSSSLSGKVDGVVGSDTALSKFLDAFNYNILMTHWHGGSYAQKASLRLMHDYISFVGGNRMLPSLDGIAYEDLYDPSGGGPFPAFFALKMLSNLSEGVSQAIPSNIEPIN